MKTKKTIGPKREKWLAKQKAKMTMIQANNKVFIVLGCSIIINKEYLKTQLNGKRTLKTLTIDLRGIYERKNRHYWIYLIHYIKKLDDYWVEWWIIMILMIVGLRLHLSHYYYWTSHGYHWTTFQLSWTKLPIRWDQN